LDSGAAPEFAVITLTYRNVQPFNESTFVVVFATNGTHVSTPFRHEYISRLAAPTAFKAVPSSTIWPSGNRPRCASFLEEAGLLIVDPQLALQELANCTERCFALMQQFPAPRAFGVSDILFGTDAIAIRSASGLFVASTADLWIRQTTFEDGKEPIGMVLADIQPLTMYLLLKGMPFNRDALLILTMLTRRSLFQIRSSL
jgi:hypothetical protein